MTYRKPASIQRAAVFSRDGRYRYHLSRRWRGPLLASDPDVLDDSLTFVMLNPSTADDQHDDATLRRVIRFAVEWGFDGLEVVNLFGLRATDPGVLRLRYRRHGMADIRGPENRSRLLATLQHARPIVVAWGHPRHGALEDAADAYLRHAARMDRALYCLGLVQDGWPRHPLRVPCATTPQLYREGRVGLMPRFVPTVLP